MTAYIFYCIGALCLSYFIIVAFLTQLNSKFHLIWILIAAFFAGTGVLISRQQAGRIDLPENVWILGAILMSGTILFFLFMSALIYLHASKTPEPGAEYLIILGAQVKKDKPSLALLCRVKVALDYAVENPETILIASGAQGSGETITEAMCMKKWLVKHGIASERILLEEQSVNTEENIAFSGRLIGDKNAYVVIATSTFHTFRSVSIAKKQGFTHVRGIGAENNRIMLPTYYLRESMAVVKYKLQNRI